VPSQSGRANGEIVVVVVVVVVAAVVVVVVVVESGALEVGGIEVVATAGATGAAAGWEVPAVVVETTAPAEQPASTTERIVTAARRMPIQRRRCVIQFLGPWSAPRSVSRITPMG
jgi:hypothetical protein